MLNVCEFICKNHFRKCSLVRIFSLILCLFMVRGVHAEPVKLLAGAHNFTLKNGLQVVVIPNHKTPVVSHALWVKAGNADDPRGKSGIAHFLEHLMFKGSSPGVAENKMMNLFEDLGADHNAMTGDDYTTYYQNLPRKHLPRVMEVMSQRIRGLSVSLASVDSERKVIIEERGMRYDNIPERQLLEAIFASLYWHHSNGISGIGWRHEMEGLSYQDAMDFYNRYYTPENMVLVLAGDVTVKDAKVLAEKYYASVPRADKFVPTKYCVEPPHHGVRTHLIKRDPRIKKRLFYYAGLMDVGRTQPMSFREAVIMELLTYLLSNDALGYTYEHFVRTQKLATHVSVVTNVPTKGQPFLLFVLVPNESHTTDKPTQEKLTQEKLTRACDDFLTGFVNMIDGDHIAKAKERLRKAETLKSDNVFYGGSEVGGLMMLGYTLDEIQSWPDVLASLTAEEVKAFAQKIAAIPTSRFGITTAEGLPAGKVARDDAAHAHVALPIKGIQ